MTKNEYRELKPRIMGNKVLTGTERDMICYELEKQIPKKPIILGTMGMEIDDSRSCPSCNGSLCACEGENYCTNCGQKLDWSEY